MEPTEKQIEDGVKAFTSYRHISPEGVVKDIYKAMQQDDLVTRQVMNVENIENIRRLAERGKDMAERLDDRFIDTFVHMLNLVELTLERKEVEL